MSDKVRSEQYKYQFRLLSCFICLIAMCCVACVDIEIEYGTKSIGVVVVHNIDSNDTTRWDIDTDTLYLADMLQEWSDTYNKQYERKGQLVTVIDALKHNASYRKYIAMYNTDKDVQVSNVNRTLVVLGITYYYNAWGAVTMPIKRGQSYLFVLQDY